jgi:hypothetical protein
MTPMPGFEKLIENFTILAVILGTVFGIVKWVVTLAFTYLSAKARSTPLKAAIGSDGAEYKRLVEQLANSTSTLTTTMTAIAAKQDDHIKVTDQVKRGVESIYTVSALNKATLATVVSNQDNIKAAIAEHDKSRRRIRR